MIECAFTQRGSRTPLPVSVGQSSSTSFRIRGELSKANEDGLASFAGTIVGSSRKSPEWLRGSLFFAKDRAVQGLFVFDEENPPTANFTIATLNQDGILDFDRSSAFLFVDPATKLSHPARYACKVEDKVD